MSQHNLAGQIMNLLYENSKLLCVWLEKHLPSIEPRWWESMVLPALSYQQRQRAEAQGFTNLSQFDLAALLRILDQNWYPISQHRNLTTQDRHFVKEMQTIRNRWAHMNADGIIPANEKMRSFGQHIDHELSMRGHRVEMPDNSSKNDSGLQGAFQSGATSGKQTTYETVKEKVKTEAQEKREDIPPQYKQEPYEPETPKESKMSGAFNRASTDNSADHKPSQNHEPDYHL